MKALIIGKNGQLAWELLQTTPAQVDVLALGRSEIDLYSFDNIREKVIHFSPDVIINASAYTAVDKAESEQSEAYAINHQAVVYLAEIAVELNIRLIHISTDFIFDGKKNTAYQIDDETNPISVYGASKLAGERAIQSIHPKSAIIVRTSWVYSSHGNNFVKTMLRLLQEKPELNVVVDQIGCPTYAKGLAKFIWLLSQLSDPNPIYHWTDLGVTSWFDFACVIQKLALNKGLITQNIKINPIPTESYPTPAKRPAFSLLALNNEDIAIQQNFWQLNLEHMLDELTNKEDCK